MDWKDSLWRVMVPPHSLAGVMQIKFAGLPGCPRGESPSICLAKLLSLCRLHQNTEGRLSGSPKEGQKTDVKKKCSPRIHKPLTMIGKDTFQSINEIKTFTMSNVSFTISGERYFYYRILESWVILGGRCLRIIWATNCWKILLPKVASGKAVIQLTMSQKWGDRRPSSCLTNLLNGVTGKEDCWSLCCSWGMHSGAREIRKCRF